MQIRALWNFAEIVNRENTDGQRAIVLFESARDTFQLIRLFAVLLLSASVMFTFYPLYKFLFNSERTLFVNLYLPFINFHHIRGYCLTMLYQLVLSSYGIFGNMAFDLFLAMIVSNYQGIVSIFECQLQELTEINRRKNTPKNRAYRRAFLRNLYIQLLDSMEWVYMQFWIGIWRNDIFLLKLC